MTDHLKSPPKQDGEVQNSTSEREQRLIDLADKHARDETSEYKFACTVLGAAESAGLLPNGLTRELRQQQAKQFVGGVIERLYDLTQKEISLLDSEAAGDGTDYKKLARELALIVDVGTNDDPGTALSKLRKIQHDAATAERKRVLDVIKRVPATAAGADAFRKRLIEELYVEAAANETREDGN